MIAPTFKSRLAQPSRQRTMPGANSSPTPQWQNERVLPMDIKFFLLSKVPPTPATALSCRSMSVAAKSLKFTLPALITKAASARITSTSISILLPEEVLGIARHRRFHFFLRQQLYLITVHVSGKFQLQKFKSEMFAFLLQVLLWCYLKLDSSLSLIEVIVCADTNFVRCVKETNLTIIKMMRNNTGTYECFFILGCFSILTKSKNVIQIKCYITL